MELLLSAAAADMPTAAEDALVLLALVSGWVPLLSAIAMALAVVATRLPLPRAARAILAVALTGCGVLLGLLEDRDKLLLAAMVLLTLALCLGRRERT